MRLLLISVCLLVLGGRGVWAAENVTHEDIILTGGPALRFMETGKAATHDIYWFNFVDASVLRLKELKSKADGGDLVTWLVYRPAYASRGREMGWNLLSQIEAKAKKYGVNLVYFDTKEQLIAYLNKGLNRDKIKITNFDYIGHSNKACFLFDYSNTIDTMSIAFLHVKDLKQIEDDVFAENATCKSWGCHSGELYSAKWKSHFDVPMTGAVGKTDFAHGGVPELSNGEGKWVQ